MIHVAKASALFFLNKKRCEQLSLCTTFLSELRCDPDLCLENKWVEWGPKTISYNLLYVMVKMWDFIIHVKDTMTFGKLPGFLHDGLGSLAVCSR